MFAILLVVAVGGLVITCAVYAYKKHQARLASLLDLCRAKGWQYSAHDPWGLPRRWEGPPFDRGYARRAEHVIAGEHAGRPLVAFDYSFKEDSTNSKGNRTTSTYRYYVVALGMPCALPGLQVSPEGVLSRLGNALGFEDIELESEEFNRRFKVRCPDPKFAMDVLSPRTMERLLASQGISFRFAGSDLLCYERGVLHPGNLLHDADVGAAVIAGIPSFVWRDYGLAESPAPTPSPGNLT